MSHEAMTDHRTAPTLVLDLDGVLHPDSVYVGEDKVPFLKGEGAMMMWAPILVGILESYPKIRIVLSTSWVRVLGVERTREYLPREISDRVIGATISKGSRLRARGREVETWAAVNAIEHWIALDDDPDGWSAAGCARLVLCDSALGIGDPTVQERLRTRLEELCR